MENTSQTGPLDGVRVLDLSTIVSGPLCGQILGDLGADVIKLEAPGGDLLRRMQPVHKGMAGVFTQFNRNKRSVVVDLRSDQGSGVARRLAERADVLIENFRPGVADRLGLGHLDLARANPGLVYVSINGFGSDGPYADQPAYDHVIQGLTGFMAVQGGAGPPQPVRTAVADKVSSLSAALAAVVALFARQNDGGRGQRVNVRMLDAFAAFMLPERLGRHAFPGADLPLPPATDTYQLLRTRDGHAIGLVMTDGHFRALCKAFDRPELLEDRRFADPGIRTRNAGALFAALEESVRNLSTDEFIALTRHHEIPFAPANDLDAFFDDPQVRHNRVYFDVEDPELGQVRQLTCFAQFEKTPSSVRRLAPKLGEHTDEVLGEAGYAPAEIRQLRETGGVH